VRPSISNVSTQGDGELIGGEGDGEPDTGDADCTGGDCTDTGDGDCTDAGDADGDCTDTGDGDSAGGDGDGVVAGGEEGSNIQYPSQLVRLDPSIHPSVLLAGPADPNSERVAKVPSVAVRHSVTRRKSRR